MSPFSVPLQSSNSNEDSWVDSDDDNDNDADISSEDDDDDFEILFEGEEEEEDTTIKELDGMEKAWRYAKKPLLSVGAKGASFSHGNSLRQLLEAHTVVKVKVNTKQFGTLLLVSIEAWINENDGSAQNHSFLWIVHIGTLEKAFEDIRDLAVESGAPEDIEMVQARDKDNIILFGMPGTIEKVEQGTFPPPPPPPYVPSPKEEE